MRNKSVPHRGHLSVVGFLRHFRPLVEAGKVMDRINERRKKRGAEDDLDQDKKKTRKFKQNKAVKDTSDKAASKAVIGSLV